MGSFAIIFVGAGIGGAARHAVNLAVRWLGYGFPLGTFVVNVVGALLLGALAGYFMSRTGVSQNVRLFLTTGVLGGFTTFSAFSLDAALLLQRQDYWMAAAYVAGTVIACVAALFAGLALFRGEGLVF